MLIIWYNFIIEKSAGRGLKNCSKSRVVLLNRHLLKVNRDDADKTEDNDFIHGTF
jgi:hypothetical protein